MALPSSGNLALSQIKTEWSGPNNLRAYLKGAGVVTTNDTAPNVPTSGNITMRSNFLGAAKVLPTPFINWKTTSGMVDDWGMTLGGNGSKITSACVTPTHWWITTDKSGRYALRTSNGTTWTHYTVGAGGPGASGQLIYCNGKLWSRQELGASATNIAYCADHTATTPTWANTPNLPAWSYARIFAGDGLLIAYGLNHSATSYVTTVDGTAWTTRTLPTAYPSAFFYLPGDTAYKYRVVRNNTGHWGSNDLVTWTSLGAFSLSVGRPSYSYDDAGLYADGNGVHIEMEAYSAYYLRKADTSSTWERYAISGLTAVRRVCFMNGKFFVLPASGSVGKVSSDGITWESITTGITAPTQPTHLSACPFLNLSMYSAQNATNFDMSY